jgi:hypothetical protein
MRAPVLTFPGAKAKPMRGNPHASTLAQELRTLASELRADMSRPSPELGERIPERLMKRLRRLDDEQLQIIEIVAIAIARGARC